MEEGRRKFGNGFARADVTNVSKNEEGRMKKEEGRMIPQNRNPNAFRPNYQFPMTNNQFPKEIGGALRPPY
jgi:hypothetical protein